MDKKKVNEWSYADAPIPPLDKLYFYLTEGCNLACRHCWLAPGFDPAGDKYPVLQLDIFRAAVQEAQPLGLKGVKLTGGEPLLHPQLLEILAIIREHGLEFIMETNGILCTQKTAEAIAKLKNPFVSVSLDGADHKTHDKIRGVQGAFTKSTNAVRHLAEAGLMPQIIMSIMPSNLDQVEDVIELAEDLGAGSVKFNIIQPTGRGETISSSNNVLQIDKLISLGRYVEDELAGKTALQLIFDYPAAFHPLKHFTAENDGCGVCSILSILGVLPSGKYALCGIGTHMEELVFGKVGSGTLTDIWKENSVLWKLRSGLPDRLTGICSHCLMKHQCLGSCIAQNYYRSHSLWAPYWFCEQAEAFGLFPASRLDFSLET